MGSFLHRWVTDWTASPKGGRTDKILEISMTDLRKQRPIWLKDHRVQSPERMKITGWVTAHISINVTLLSRELRTQIFHQWERTKLLCFMEDGRQRGKHYSEMPLSDFWANIECASSSSTSTWNGSGSCAKIWDKPTSRGAIHNTSVQYLVFGWATGGPWLTICEALIGYSPPGNAKLVGHWVSSIKGPNFRKDGFTWQGVGQLQRG